MSLESLKPLEFPFPRTSTPNHGGKTTICKYKALQFKVSTNIGRMTTLCYDVTIIMGLDLGLFPDIYS